MWMPIRPDRVIQRRTELGLSQGDLASAIGMKQQGIQSIEAGAVDRPRKLRELAAALETTQEWLLGEDDVNPTEFHPVALDVRGMPIRGEVAGGLWLEVDTAMEEPLGWLPFTPESGLPREATYALKVRGNSVDKIAPDGSILVCVDLGIAGIEVKEGDLVVVERHQVQEGLKEVTVKRVRRARGGFELVPESTDPRWKSIKYDRQPHNNDMAIRIVARVEWVASRPVRP